MSAGLLPERVRAHEVISGTEQATSAPIAVLDLGLARKQRLPQEGTELTKSKMDYKSHESHESGRSDKSHRSHEMLQMGLRSHECKRSMRAQEHDST